MAGWAGAGVAVAVGLGLLGRWRRAGSRWGPARWALRVGVVVACAIACLSPSYQGAEARRRRAVVLDVSRSLARARAQRADWVRAALADLEAGRDEAALILAAAEVRVALPLQPVERVLERLEQALTLPLDERGSDLGGGLRAAAAEGVDEVLLLTDGRDTRGSLLQAAGELAAAGVALHALAPDVPRPLGVRLARLEAPARVAPGERIAVRVEAVASRPGPLTVVLELEDALGIREVGRVSRPARPHAPWSARFSVPPLPEPGLVTLRARALGVGPDDDPSDDVREQVCAVGDPPRVWRVGAGPLEGIPSRELTPAELAAALEREAPDLVLLVDVPARALGPAVGRLKAAVEAGAGLIVGGAGLAFGPGGYAETALEALLPVTSGPAQQRASGLDLVVALDASGSMGAPDAEGRTRYQQSVSAAVPTHLVRAGDRLGVVLFAGQPELFAPLGSPAVDLLERLARHTPGGETDVGAALALGLETLQDGGDRDASLIVATDSEDPDPRRHADAIRALAGGFAPGRLRVLLVLIGRAAETGSLEALARAVGPVASVVRAADADRALRELVASELATRRNERRVGRFAVALTEAGAAYGLRASEAVEAYAPTQLRPEAETLAVVRDAETDDPPGVALWRVGAGRVLAAPVAAGGLDAVLGEAVGRLLPPAREALALEARRLGPQLEVVVQGSVVGTTRLRVVGADGSAQVAELVPETPTRARARCERVSSAALQVVAVDPLGQRLAGVAVPATGVAELAAVGPDPGPLSDATQATGGRLLAVWPTPERPLPARAGVSPHPLSPWWLGLALALFVVEVGLVAGARRSG